jgi:hypothetical protein
MNKLLSRVLTAAVLIASAVTAGVWLARPPLAGPVAAPAKIIPEPTWAPLPISAAPKPTIIEARLEAEIAATAAPKPPAVKPTEKPAETRPQPNCPPRRRGLFRRR